MLNPFNLIFSLLFIIITTKAQIPSQEPRFVIELYRHGARGPVNTTYDPSWGDNAGELTPTGMRMHYILGTALRNTYPSILNTTYNPGSIYVRSTDVNRTIMSAYSQLYGIYQQTGPKMVVTGNLSYPPYNIDSEILSEVTNETGIYALPNSYQPIPVHVVDQEYDTFLLSYDASACPNSVIGSSQAVNSNEFLTNYKNYLPVVKQINQAINTTLNLTINGPDDLINFGDTAIADEFDGRPIPGNFSQNSTIWKNITFAFQYFLFYEFFGLANYTSLYAVPMFDQLLSYMNQVINGTTNLQFLFLSSHDTTLSLLLAALNIVNTDCLWDNFWNHGIINDTICHYPSFASNIKIELWENQTNDNEWYVNFYYDDVLLQVPGCNGYNCSFGTFQQVLINATDGYTQAEYNLFCNVTTNNIQITTNNNSDNDRTYIIVIIVLGSVSLIMLAIISILCIKMKSMKSMEEAQLNQFNSAQRDIVEAINKDIDNGH